MGSRLESGSAATRKRIENHTFDDETGEEYDASRFGGFPEYFRRKKIKLQNLDAELRASSHDKPQIFKGIVAHVSGYTQPPLQDLHKELVQHGAGFLQYLDSKTSATHIIASSLPPKKIIDLGKYRVVKPAWIMDSIKAGKLLPWANYKVVDEGPRQKTIHFDGNKIFSQSNHKQSPMRYREQTQDSPYRSQFRGQVSQGASDTEIVPEAKTDARASSEVETQDHGDTIPDVTISAAVDRGARLPPKEAPGASKSNEDHNDKSFSISKESSLAQPKRENLQKPKSRLDAGEPQPSKSPLKKQSLTSEEHNAILLSDPHIRKSSTANPDFLKQYCSESRLHHLSTWKADLKSRLQKLAATKSVHLGDSKKKAATRRYIIHVDFDSFFCAVSLKNAPPEFAQRAAAVAHGQGTGSEIASCNYPARSYGIKNGMWMKRALELCPDLKVLPYDFPGSEEASRLFYERILAVGGVVQSVSVDEALVDATSLVLTAVGSDGIGVNHETIRREQLEADKMATEIRAEIKAKTKCDVSIGIGGNILQAKVALRKAKPAGQYQLIPDDVLNTFAELTVGSLPGVAFNIGAKLEGIGVKFIRDMLEVPKTRLSTILGPKTGEKLWEYARGIDQTEVGDQPVRKSVSAEVNWGIRFMNQLEAEGFVYNLCRELESRLLKERVKGRNLTMKIMRRAIDADLDPPKHLGHGKCDVFNKGVVFGVATHDAEVIGREAVLILRSYHFSPGDLRGLGVQLTKLESIKAPKNGLEGSQKRLIFGTVGGGAAKRIIEDLIDEETAYRGKDEKYTATGVLSRHVTPDHISDDPLTPRKPKRSQTHPALSLARSGEKDYQVRTPLNVAGTQFIMPTNPDPEVLSELPVDIRTQLVAQHQQKNQWSASKDRDGEASMGNDLEPNPRTQTPTMADIDEIPPDVDPEVFVALPNYMKMEIISSYRRREVTGRRSLPPQSPGGKRTSRPPTTRQMPTKSSGRASGSTLQGMWNCAAETRDAPRLAVAHKPLTNVSTDIASAEISGGSHSGGAFELPDVLDPAFLAEPPEEVRNEVIAYHNRRRLTDRVGQDCHTGAALGRLSAVVPDVDGPRARFSQPSIAFPALPKKTRFSVSEFTSTAEVKETLTAWYKQSMRADAEGESAEKSVGDSLCCGPHTDDVRVFSQFLDQIIKVERDIEKATMLVRWLEVLVAQGESEHDGGENEVHGPAGIGLTRKSEETKQQGRKAQNAWQKAIGIIKRQVQGSVRDRGLGELDI